MKDTVVKYWTDSTGDLLYQTQKGYCGLWDNPGWNRLPLPPGCHEDTEWYMEREASKKLDKIKELLNSHREKQYYCRTQADESLWKETLETLFEEETK